MPKPSLTPTMQAALDLAKTSPTRRLYLWSGGYWCQTPEPEDFFAKGRTLPQEHAQVGTINALQRRGYLRAISGNTVEVINSEK